MGNCGRLGLFCLPLVCPHRGPCEEPLHRGDRVCNGRASSVFGVVPRSGSHLDHRIHLCLPADDHSWSRGYLLLYEVNPSPTCCHLDNVSDFRLHSSSLLVSEGINPSCRLLPSSPLSLALSSTTWELWLKAPSSSRLLRSPDSSSHTSTTNSKERWAV